MVKRMNRKIGITEYLTDLMEYGLMEGVRKDEISKGFIPVYRKECPVRHERGSKRVDFAFLRYNEEKNDFDIYCVEIKSGHVDLHSTMGRNFDGNMNFICVTEKDKDDAVALCENLYPHVGVLVVYGIIGAAFMDDDIYFDWRWAKEPVYIDDIKDDVAIYDFICSKNGLYAYIRNKEDFDYICDKFCHNGNDELLLYEKYSDETSKVIFEMLERKYN